MKAITRRQYGNAQRIFFKDLPIPKPGEQELLIKVHCHTINRTDCAILHGKPYLFRFFIGWPKPKKQILGTDFAGEVVKVGSGVKEFKPGDRVFGFNDQGLASQAEYCCISQSEPIIGIPDGISYRAAAASIEGAHYAINFLRYTKLRKGEKVLVLGATGAIGSALIQILKARGIRVDAVGPENYRDYWQSRGVERYWDYKSKSPLPKNKAYVAVFDAVGKSSFFQCRSVLQKGGLYISSELGPFASNLFLALFAGLMPKAKVKFPYPLGLMESLSTMQNLLAEGKYRPLIDPIKLGPSAAEEAYNYVDSGEKIGNFIMEWS
ncbi:MAG: NAD(P)-dependent alcohol dehydrogenase [Bacteroidetes bacterium]|nr:NAD(P)-dependent alcohol dehydrogenase [Bacteroidota bacterium]